ncbi:hypothetical protein WJX75_002883 [Coccomyxa subellipsoidea]|uniref:Plastid lipid-associated protein/fibrillin conserved domain-containing protein n=1 Tax=Coccomyxa subellipsoidea TaxID=248742 RepID=A0ABR2YRE8_9CHLO
MLPAQRESSARSQKRPPVCQQVQTCASLEATASTTQILNVANNAKRDLLSALLSVQDTGVYGLESAQREELLRKIENLEACNPLESPTEHLDQCHGSWRLLFSTVTILGRRRIKLGLRNIVNVGELSQHIDTATCHTVG